MFLKRSGKKFSRYDETIADIQNVPECILVAPYNLTLGKMRQYEKLLQAKPMYVINIY